jgi:GAF domain-containing protein
MTAPSNQDPTITTALHRITAVLPDSTVLVGALDRMLAVIVDHVPDLAGCGITLLRNGQDSATTVSASAALVGLVDEAQYSGGDGPCLTSLRTGTMVNIKDLDAEKRWPHFREVAQEHGVGSVFSHPLAVGDLTVGVLNCYGSRAGAFGLSLTTTLGIFARQIEIVLESLLQQLDQAKLAAELRDALTSRAVIDQAIGILMGHHRCDSKTAFETLRAASNNSNVPLRDIARQLVNSVAHGDPPSD